MPLPLNPPVRNPTENGEGLFRQFQAWAVEKDEQAEVGPVQSVQDAPAQVVHNAPALVVQNAPAQIAEETRASLKPKQSTDTSAPSVMHGQRCGPCTIPE
jgi:hypothetical protein